MLLIFFNLGSSFWFIVHLWCDRPFITVLGSMPCSKLKCFGFRVWFTSGMQGFWCLHREKRTCAIDQILWLNLLTSPISRDNWLLTKAMRSPVMRFISFVINLPSFSARGLQEIWQMGRLRSNTTCLIISLAVFSMVNEKHSAVYRSASTTLIGALPTNQFIHSLNPGIKRGPFRSRCWEIAAHCLRRARPWINPESARAARCLCRSCLRA